MISRLRPGMVGMLLVLTVSGLILYANAVHHPFVHDDTVFILKNPSIERWDDLAPVFLAPQQTFASDVAVVYFRPLLEVVYRFQYLIFGPHPEGYHLFNILLHIVNSWLVLLAAKGWGLRRGGAFGAAVIFLIHPVQSEAVACIAGISNVLSAFLILSVWVWLSPGRKIRKNAILHGLSIYPFALLTKEIAMLLPIFVGLYRGGRQGHGRKWWKCFVALLLMAGGFWLWRSHIMPGGLTHGFQPSGETILRLLAVPGIVLMYASLLIVPTGLHYYRSTDILFVTWPWAVPLLGFLVWALRRLVAAMSRREKYAFGAAMIWGLVFLIPALNIIPLINEYSLVMTAEHFLYVSMPGFAAALVVAGQFLIRRAGTTVRPWFIRSAVLVLIAAGSALTVYQNTFWRGEVPLFERVAAFEPNFGRIHILLGLAYEREGQLQKAVRALERGQEIMEGYAAKSALVPTDGAGKARGIYLRFARQVRVELGGIYLRAGNSLEAARYLRAALVLTGHGQNKLEERNENVGILISLGMAELGAGNRAAARQAWQQAIQLEGRNADAFNNLGMLAKERGDWVAARFFFRQALRIRPHFIAAKMNLLKCAP